MPRRTNHEGTFRRRGNSWQVGVQIAGHRHWASALSRAEARRKLQELLERHYRGQLSPPSRMTLGEWAERWLRESESRLRPRTLLTYRQALAPVTALLGYRRLDSLEPVHIHQALEELRERGRGARSLEQAHVYLHGCLERAKELGLVGYNPLERVPKPRCQAEERPTWSLEDMRRFLGTAADSEQQLGPMFALQLLTGLRPAEALGLQWQDVDLKAGTLHVRRAVVWAGSQWHVQNPKTRAGERTIALPCVALALLQLAPKRLPWVFWQDRPPTRKQVSFAMRALCRESGVPKTSAQYLRHAHATLLAAQGLDVKALQARMGHARAGLTLDVYAHALADGERRAAELVDGALGVRQAGPADRLALE